MIVRARCENCSQTKLCRVVLGALLCSACAGELARIEARVLG